MQPFVVVLLVLASETGARAGEIDGVDRGGAVVLGQAAGPGAAAAPGEAAGPGEAVAPGDAGPATSPDSAGEEPPATGQDSPTTRPPAGTTGAAVPDDVASPAGDDIGSPTADDPGSTRDDAPPAQDPFDALIRDESDERGLGLAVSAMLGLTGFTDGTSRELVDTGAGYSARLHVGTHWPVGFELAYVGSVQELTAPGLASDAILVSHGAEAAFRASAGRGAWRPFVLAGVAWRRFDLADEQPNTSALRGPDNVLELPVALGIGWRSAGFVADLRVGYRFAADEQILGPSAGLDAWSAGFRVGHEL